VEQPRAVVTDDDFLIRLDACAILERAGYCALPAASAEEALAVLERQSQQVQLLFTDVNMPGSGMDGFALARRVAESWSWIRIIVASGHASPADGDMPPHGRFINKPFSAELVENVLQELLPEEQLPKPLKEKRHKTQ
jgi:CheY-like chemotaxis protein